MAQPPKMNPGLEPFIPIVRGLAKILGKDYEVNLHDVSMPEHSLIICENGYVTGRREGGPMTDFGLYMLQSEEYRTKDGIFNYLARNNRGELIKCSCIFIRDESSKIIGFLCINYDLKKAIAARELIESLVKVDMAGVEQYPESGTGEHETENGFPEPVREAVAQDLEEVVDDTLEQTKRKIGKPFRYLSKPEKKQVIAELRDKGFFLLKGSVDRLATEMGNTKFTIYSYIRDIQKTTKS